MSHPNDGADTDPLFDEAATALDAGDAEEAATMAHRGARRALRDGAPGLQADFLWLEGAALGELGDPVTALARLDEALELAPDHLDAMLERGHALFELGRFEEARAQLEEVLRLAPDEAWAHHQLGLLAERRGDAKLAERGFARARRLDPQAFPAPVRVPRAEFERLVEEALTAIPEPVRRHLANVPITVEDVPELQDLAGTDPPLSPGSLGLFRGAPYGQKGSGDPWSQLPSAIVLFQRNLERAVSSRAELEQEIRTTLIHEVGHFLGLDEGELLERGLE